MSQFVIGIAGGIGSGKSTIAKLLAARLQCPIASYGQYFRSLVQESDPERKRVLMQHMSGELISSIGIHTITAKVLENVKWAGKGSLVVDGIRSGASIDALHAACWPIPTAVIYLEVDKEIRFMRFKTRDNLSVKDLQTFDSHPTEVSVHTEVKSLANIVVDGNGSAEQIVELILQKLQIASN